MMEILVVNLNDCLEDASTIGKSKLTSESMANTVNISINCISPVSSSNESNSSEEDDVLTADEDMRV